MAYPLSSAATSTVGMDTPTASTFGDFCATQLSSGQVSDAAQLIRTVIDMLEDPNPPRTLRAEQPADILKRAEAILTSTIVTETPIRLPDLDKMISRCANQASFSRFGIDKGTAGHVYLSAAGKRFLQDLNKASNGICEVTSTVTAGLDSLVGRTERDDKKITAFIDSVAFLLKLADNMPSRERGGYVNDEGPDFSAKIGDAQSSWTALKTAVKEAAAANTQPSEIAVKRDEEARLPVMALSSHADQVETVWEAEDAFISKITSLTKSLGDRLSRFTITP